MSFKKTLYIIQNNVVQFPCNRSNDVVFRPDTHLSSIILPNDENSPSGPSLYKLRTVLDCILPDVSATRPDAFQCSTSKNISFQNTNMGRQLQLSERLIKERLDRSFASSDSISHLLAHNSDHNPLFLNTATPVPTLPKPFRFEEFWTHDQLQLRDPLPIIFPRN